MARSSVFLRLWIAIISVAILAMPVSAAHLHLCLDGSEPPATLHAMQDAAHPADDGVSPAHHDVDVSITSSALAKKLDRVVDLPPLITAALIVFRIPAAPPVLFFPEPAARVVADSLSELPPPSRGPPV